MMPEPIDLFTYDSRVIVSAGIRDQGSDFLIQFDDGSELILIDNAQLCCENRYVATDDDPNDLIGGRLLRIILKGTGSEDKGYDCEDIQFVEVCTNQGSIVLNNYVVHNGYYGGWDLQILDDGKRRYVDPKRQAQFNRDGY